MKPLAPLVRRIETLERNSGDGPETGIRQTDPEALEQWWEQWDGTETFTAGRPGVALVAFSLTLAEWAAEHGTVEADTENKQEI